MERCCICGRMIDTDHDVEGEYDSSNDYACSRCCDTDDLKLTPITTKVAEFSPEFLAQVEADLKRYAK